ncbi:STN and carboxypeptidase regulatory-like domain-containing protein [Dyadobacter arcticus]|uniref:CarboxypepD_reg-like domain-containing protein n=1 Tax=Dyadobacter arcticus TaxID=1078754 RepID=A0ABX0UN52_9BACT|nr:STN and carboxypeptidase regulatory-like domain-containing protein [Dyadobacter arcticus]NIJ53409.1 hypothetical protein [Dyadobacter arcticus]
MAVNKTSKEIFIRKNSGLIFLLTLLLSLCQVNTLAQELLEKKITIKVKNRPLDETLQKIGNLGDFSFSYSPDIMDVKVRISIQATNLSVREILNELFKGNVTFKERRRYVILQKSNAPEEPEQPEDFNLNGYIIDNKTGRKLANASIYESVTLASTVSNQYGYYKIRLPAYSSSVRLEIRKEDYIGKSIPISTRQDAYLQINLYPDTLKPLVSKTMPVASARGDSLHHRIAVPNIQLVSIVEIFPDTIPETDTTTQRLARIDREKLRLTYQKVQSKLVSAFASAKQAIHTRNIQDSLYRPFQASMLPFLGTNHELSGNIVNDYSINLLAGYSLGVNKLEVGGVVNVVRGNVRGFQLAGISNIVGGNVTGFQYANVLNLTLGNFTGFQGSNLINYTGQHFSGFQVAGVGNVVVGTLDGYQFSAGYNYAQTVHSGHQIGAVNYSDSSATVPFGLFSYVHSNGYRRYEFSSDEFNYFNTAFKTGMSRFYNIFSLAFNGMAANKPLLSLGYGFGTAQNLGKGWMVNADVTANAIILRNQEIEDIDTGMLKFSLGIEKKLGRKFALFAGPSISLLRSDSDVINSEETKGIKPIWLGKRPNKINTNYAWVGFQAGIRICN